MKWWSVLVVSLAAPVWSHNHNQIHRQRNARRPCQSVQTASISTTTLATAAATQASEHLEAVQAAKANVHHTTIITSVVASTTAATYAVQTAKPTASASSATTTTAPGRAIWLWDSDLIKDSDEIAEFLLFAESNDITAAYTLIDRDMGDAVFQNFIAQCNTSGIAVEALMGNSDWILGTGDPTLESQLEWLEQYQGNASANSRFAGIHFDIEPWALDDWESNKETYISALQSIVTQVTALGTKLGLPVAADLPYWAYTITCASTGQTLDHWMLENIDTATFMTYRNTAAELLDIATVVLEAGVTSGKPVWLAVETVDAADALLISYYGKTFTDLTNDLLTVNTTAAVYNSFAGIAIHDYAGVKALSS